MSSGNVTLHPFNSGAAAILQACPERAQRVERETSLDISVLTRRPTTEIVRDSSTPVGMTAKAMKCLIQFGLLSLVAIFASRSSFAEPQESESASEIRAVLSAQQEAWNRGDIEGFMNGYWRS